MCRLVCAFVVFAQPEDGFSHSEANITSVIPSVLCIFQSHNGQVNWKEEMRTALEQFVGLLEDEHTVSAFELYSSNLVQTLLNILSNVSKVR